MKKRLLLIILVLMGINSFAQNVQVKGKITSVSEGLTLPGVTVLIKGTTNGTITDLDGIYSLEVAKGATLVFSFVGYKPQEVVVADQREINISLDLETKGLDEIIVVGYGTQKKSLVTGAIAKIDNDAIKSTPALRVEQALQGRSAGVSISQESGSPGGALTVRVRGTGSNKNSDPLYIVDGMPTGGIDYLNPGDIESIEVLKDAASGAIYGAQAANGVVLISTKSGKKGQSQVDYDFYYGTQTVANKIKLLNARDYSTYFREAMKNAGTPEKVINDELPDPATAGEGTDWMGAIFQSAPIQNHNITFRGGNENTTFMASGSYFTQDGILGGDKANYTRYTARINGEHKVNKWLKVGTRMSYTNFARNTVDENNEFGGMISNAIILDPLTPVRYKDLSEVPEEYTVDTKYYPSYLVKDDQGYFGMSTKIKNEIRNPLAAIYNRHQNYNQDKFLGGFYADVTLMKGLVIHTNIDLDLAYGGTEQWEPKAYFHSLNKVDISSMSKDINRYNNWQWENNITYTKSIKDNNFSLMAGTSAKDDKHTYLIGRGQDLIEESDNFALLDYAMNDSLRRASGGYREESRLYSYYARATYDFKEKYMATATFRRDGSSKFGTDNVYGNFPSFSLGWIVSKESFWNFGSIFDNFKVRGSWGQNGSLSVLSNFGYVSLITTQNINYVNPQDQVITGAVPAKLSNSALQWETSEQTDIGIDMGFFNSKLTLSADYYVKKTKGLLTEGPVAYYVGNNKPTVNAGDVENTGFEFELAYKNSYAGLNYSISANGAYLKNEAKYIGNGAGELNGANFGTGQTVTKFKMGYPIWSFFGYKTAGIFQSDEEAIAYVNSKGEKLQSKATAGDVKFVDINNDGVINASDQTIIGNPWPKWTYGLTINLDYKGLDFSCFLQGVTGNDILMAYHRNDLGMSNIPQDWYDKTWWPDKPSTSWFKATYDDRNVNYRASDLFISDGSFMRLKNLQMGYSLPASLCDMIKVKKLRVYVSGTNLFIKTKYKGMDPEIGRTAGDNSVGVDRGLYPQSRQYLVGLNLSF